MTFIEHNKKATVDAFILCYNEEVILPHLIKHLYKHFKANVTIFDNKSTDNSVAIAKNMGCNVKSYDSNNQIRDDLYLNIKNNCWKGSKADWVFIGDADEFLEVNFNVYKYTILNVKGYDVLGPFFESRTGVANRAFNKPVMFRPNCFTDINYTPGCHSAAPVGTISGSIEFATLLHRKYLTEEYVYKKHKEYESRLSDFNKKYQFGFEYEGVTEQSIKEKFNQLRQNAIQIP